MRLTPAQVGMSLLLGDFVARLSTGDLKADISRDWLVRIGGEFEVARARGFDASIFSFEDFERGRFNPRPWPVPGES